MSGQDTIGRINFNNRPKTPIVYLHKEEKPPQSGSAFDYATKSAAEGTTVQNEKGGKQSLIYASLSLLPPEAQLRKGEILATGAVKYGKDNWRNLPLSDHLDHALRHIFLYLDGDTSEDHLGNAACRIDFALATQISEKRTCSARQ